MAHKSVGTPRFYIDQYIYLKSTGIDTREYFQRFYWAVNTAAVCILWRLFEF